jgi:hypothetical protein
LFFFVHFANEQEQNGCVLPMQFSFSIIDS